MKVKVISLTLLLAVIGRSHSQARETYNELWLPNETSEGAATAVAYGTGDGGGAVAEAATTAVTSAADGSAGHGLPYPSSYGTFGSQEQGRSWLGSSATAGDGLYSAATLLGYRYPIYAAAAGGTYGESPLMAAYPYDGKVEAISNTNAGGQIDGGTYQSHSSDEAAASGAVSVGVRPEVQNQENVYSEELISSATISSTAAKVAASDDSPTGLFTEKENSGNISVGGKSSAAGTNYIYGGPYFEYGSVTDPSTGSAAVYDGSYLEEQQGHSSEASGGRPYLTYDYPVDRAVYLVNEYPVYDSATVAYSTAKSGETYVVPYWAYSYPGYGSATAASRADRAGGNYVVPY